MTDLPPSLRPSAADHGVTALKFITDIASVAAPGAGAFFSMLVGEIIPGQREDRIAEYVARLARRIRIAEGRAEEIDAKFEALAASLSADQTALVEDGAVAAARATSTERIEGIAAVVATGINEDAAQAADQRRLLQLMSDLTDDEIVVLCSYTHAFGEDDAWHDKHKAVLAPVAVSLGSDREEADRSMLRDMRMAKLLRLGVMREKPSSTGRSMNRDLSPLGRHVLVQMGLLQPGQF